MLTADSQSESTVTLGATSALPYPSLPLFRNLQLLPPLGKCRGVPGDILETRQLSEIPARKKSVSRKPRV